MVLTSLFFFFKKKNYCFGKETFPGVISILPTNPVTTSETGDESNVTDLRFGVKTILSKRFHDAGRGKCSKSKILTWLDLYRSGLRYFRRTFLGQHTHNIRPYALKFTREMYIFHFVDTRAPLLYSTNNNMRVWQSYLFNTRRVRGRLQDTVYCFEENRIIRYVRDVMFLWNDSNSKSHKPVCCTAKIPYGFRCVNEILLPAL